MLPPAKHLSNCCTSGADLGTDNVQGDGRSLSGDGFSTPIKAFGFLQVNIQLTLPLFACWCTHAHASSHKRKII